MNAQVLPLQREWFGRVYRSDVAYLYQQKASVRALSVFMVLSSRVTWCKDGSQRPARVGMTQLAADLGVKGTKTVQRGVDELVRLNMVKVQRTGRTHIYWVLRAPS